MIVIMNMRMIMIMMMVISIISIITIIMYYVGINIYAEMLNDKLFFVFLFV